ncbi:MAG: hypothetical protein ACT4OH_07000 [Methylophilaceae bacterium]
MITIVKDDKHLITIHYDTTVSDIKRYTIWNEGISTVVVAKEGEAADIVWQHVLDRVKDMRAALLIAERSDPYMQQSGYHRGNPYRHAHVYAGIEPTQDDIKTHMKQWIIWTLWQLASPHHNRYDNGEERVAALTALAGLLGIHAAKKVQIHLTGMGAEAPMFTSYTS